MRCGDCGTHQGDLHQWGCDQEECPFCGGQLISCNCCYERIGYRVESWRTPAMGLPLGVYLNGLSKAEDRKWRAILDKRGRRPYISFPNLCSKCGTLHPDLIMYPTWMWEYYVPLSMQKTIICDACFQSIKEQIDAYFGPPRLVKCTFCDGRSQTLGDCWACAGTHTVLKGWRQP